MSVQGIAEIDILGEFPSRPAVQGSATPWDDVPGPLAYPYSCSACRAQRQFSIFIVFSRSRFVYAVIAIIERQSGESGSALFREMPGVRIGGCGRTVANCPKVCRAGSSGAWKDPRSGAGANFSKRPRAPCRGEKAGRSASCPGFPHMSSDLRPNLAGPSPLPSKSFSPYETSRPMAGASPVPTYTPVRPLDRK